MGGKRYFHLVRPSAIINAALYYFLLPMLPSKHQPREEYLSRSRCSIICVRVMASDLLRKLPRNAKAFLR